MLTPSFRRILCSLEWTVLGWAERMFAAIFRIFVLLGVQSWHSLPAMRGLWTPQPGTITSSVLLWVALLCLAPAIRSNGPPRAVLTLEPPWFNVLQGDNVTLNCEVFQTLGHHSIEWLHNGSALPIHQDSYTIPAVNIEDSGEYQCRTEHTALSNSVKLQVFSDWLLLQVERLEFMEGDSMILRCHSWRSKPLHKVAYYHNDQALKYELQSFDYIVPQVNYTHSGSYYCTGFMGHISHLSATVVITVQGLFWIVLRRAERNQTQRNTLTEDKFTISLYFFAEMGRSLIVQH
ncbi:low affinity immunoglobulin gamma Fc region receptor III-A-like isoform X2 [Phascolarctos cinereus]|uniref:low affinity immunoglobulin gamma Fc region receptor II-like isoform X3 n=1 Tax=Phascolarctos cinereus TaxID=38626 RepID=UPI000A280137|nr:low affinity immunoglobulin gamma Fc region receptor II-like isoform X3 [Phascolarctos cinereus]